MNFDTQTQSPAAPLDVEAIRRHFPALHDGAAHFDGPGGTQTPDVVADAIRHTMLRPLSNRSSSTAAGRNAEDAVTECRAASGMRHLRPQHDRVDLRDVPDAVGTVVSRR